MAEAPSSAVEGYHLRLEIQVILSANNCRELYEQQSETMEDIEFSRDF